MQISERNFLTHYTFKIECIDPMQICKTNLMYSKMLPFLPNGVKHTMLSISLPVFNILFVNSRELSRENGRLTDADRDQIDADAEKIMKLCNESIKGFKSQGIQSSNSSANLKKVFNKFEPIFI